MRLRLYYGLAAILLFVIGCGLFKGEKKYLPLAVGNEWDYTMTTHNATYQNDTLVSDTTFTHHYTSKITGTDKTTGGVEVYVMISTFESTTDTTYLEERDDDIYSYSSLSDTNPILVLDHPLDDGKTWSSGGFTYEVIGSEDVSVKAGDFSCKKIKVTYSGVESYFWYAEGVGEVKYSYADTSEVAPGTKLITEVEEVLDDYTVK
ncbi:hypothetical protein DRP53_00575 [candidate division WOR-3 bacterium]|uniref:DUF3108 domain-containing protein n=1 Tax=candidate division WOR-3 bacterium TaxID=2052148 RepID=A0A660SLW9_UNCW3|nr:MAG: hypothetical protein DRP53_00575 [candidate division WOR-3 bacterium]